VSEESQKAILALDGGGLRGAFTLGFLGELESLIARKTGKGEDFVLADYFDFIGGPPQARSLPPACRWVGVLTD
jgi:uncharacterized protein